MPTIRRCLPMAALAATLAAQCTPTPPSPYPGFSHRFDVVVDGSLVIPPIDCLRHDDANGLGVHAGLN